MRVNGYRSLGFGITGSTSYIPPYKLVREWSTLDHLTEWRVGELPPFVLTYAPNRWEKDMKTSG